MSAARHHPKLGQRSRPRLHRDVRCARQASEAGPDFPVSLLVGSGAEIDASIGPTRRRLSRLGGRRSRRLSPSLPMNGGYRYSTKQENHNGGMDVRSKR